jgi:alkyl hydroperoxide reductase subunit AhpC
MGGNLESYLMLGVGSAFPEYQLSAVVSTEKDGAFRIIHSADFAGEWKVYFFWPKDFTQICPTEIAGFARLHRNFATREATVLGASVDSEYAHLAWRRSHSELRDLPFPLLSDVKRELCEALGIIDPQSGVAQRATYIVDPAEKIRFVSIHDASVGRSPQEILRVLIALQTDQLCGCDWQPGDETLSA